MALKILSIHFISLFITLLTFGLLAASYYFQYSVGLQPCPLCLVQRYALMLIAGVFLLATWQNPQRVGQRIYTSIGLLFTAIGALAATRQIWLQQQPLGATDSCMPNLSYLLKLMPLHKAFWLFISSPTNCAQIAWQFLGISMAGWSFGFFFILIVAMLWQLKQS